MTDARTRIFAALVEKSGVPMIERRGQWLTGAEILTRIESRAQELSDMGLTPGQTALIVVSDNLVAMETLFGCWMLGAAGALVDFRTPPDRINRLAQTLEAGLVTGRRKVDGVQMQLQAVDPKGRLTRGKPLEKLDRDSNAVVFMTSGTTGPPKLRPTPHGRLDRALGDFCATEVLAPGDCVLSATSVGYSASCYSWLRALACGKRIVSLDLLYRLEELDQALRRPDVTECGLPPVLIRRLAALAEGGKGYRYPQLTRLASVGGPASARDKIAAVTRLSPQYRMTYSCVGVGLVSRITGAEVLDRPASCGKVQDDVTVTVLDGTRVCAANETGALEITNAYGSTVRPGDMGWLDDDGYLYIAGRVEGMFCRNGVNFPAERLTQAALDLPDVIAAAAIAGPDGDDGDVIHLFVQCPDGQGDRVARHLRQALPAAEYPDHIHRRDKLPTTISGKVDLHALTNELKPVREDGNASC